MRKVLLGALAIILVSGLIITGCAASSSPPSTSAPASQPAPTPASPPPTLPTPPSPETAIKISAAKLYADYEANEVAADLKYKDKLLEVSGVVTDIGISESLRPGTPVIFLAESVDVPFMEGVTIYLSADQKTKVATLSKGDMVTVVCVCEGVALVRGTEEFGFRRVRLKDGNIVD